MKQILGDRQSGKTHQLMQMYIESKRNGEKVIVLVPDERQRNSLIVRYQPHKDNPDFEYFDVKDFVVFCSKDTLRGRDQNTKVFVDNIEWLFKAFIGYDVEAYSLNVENWPGIAGKPLPERWVGPDSENAKRLRFNIGPGKV